LVQHRIAQRANQSRQINGYGLPFVRRASYELNVRDLFIALTKPPNEPHNLTRPATWDFMNGAVCSAGHAHSLHVPSQRLAMAIRYTVYCKRSVAAVTPEQLLAGVQVADLHTIAENDDIPDDVIVDALGQLRIENVDPIGFRFYRFCYRPAGKRPIDVERWQNAEEVQGVVAEVLASLADDGHPALARIRTHLQQTVDIVDASFGSSPEEQMAPVLASEVARWLAEKFDGIIRAADDTWWELGPRYHEYQPLRP
jgi:hypothetical protein